MQTEKVGGTLLETLSCKDTTGNDMMMMKKRFYRKTELAWPYDEGTV